MLHSSSGKSGRVLTASWNVIERNDDGPGSGKRGAENGNGPSEREGTSRSSISVSIGEIMSSLSGHTTGRTFKDSYVFTRNAMTPATVLKIPQIIIITGGAPNGANACAKVYTARRKYETAAHEFKYSDRLGNMITCNTAHAIINNPRSVFCILQPVDVSTSIAATTQTIKLNAGNIIIHCSAYALLKSPRITP